MVMEILHVFSSIFSSGYNMVRLYFDTTEFQKRKISPSLISRVKLFSLSHSSRRHYRPCCTRTINENFDYLLNK